MVVDDGGPNFSLIGNPQQLIGTELAAVGGFGQSGFGEQLLQADGDDHRGGGATGDRLIFHFQQPGTGLI